MLFFAIPQIEYLKGPVNADTGKFKNNPGWSVNGCKTIFGFNYLLNNNGTLAHEFGHAFGLEHTFSDEKEVVKKKDKHKVEQNEFYLEVNSKFKTIDFLTNKSSRYYKNWSVYSGQKQAISGLNTVIKELSELVKKEGGVINTIKIESPMSIVQKYSEEKLKEGSTKENIMDYLESDADRKVFTIEQIIEIGNV